MPKASRFGKVHSLHLASEFRRVREAGASCVGRWIILGVLRNPYAPSLVPSCPAPSPPASTGIDAAPTGQPGGPPRFGIIASRKIGGAVVRNKFRRRIRHIHQNRFPQIQGTPWLVVVARHGASRANFAQLDAEWCKLARKAGLLTP